METVAAVFTSAGEVMTGYITMGIKGIEALMSNPIGVVCVLLPIGIGATSYILRKFKRR